MHLLFAAKMSWLHVAFCMYVNIGYIFKLASAFYVKYIKNTCVFDPILLSKVINCGEHYLWQVEVPIHVFVIYIIQLKCEKWNNTHVELIYHKEKPPFLSLLRLKWHQCLMVTLVIPKCLVHVIILKGEVQIL